MQTWPEQGGLTQAPLPDHATWWAVFLCAVRSSLPCVQDDIHAGRLVSDVQVLAAT
jgi:hypothetical protein